MTRHFGLFCLGALAVAFAACASNNVSQCEATGVLCPSGMHCAAAEPICLKDDNLCGNAHPDPDEECDDGNTKDGDGCSHECKAEVCGNGHIDSGEVCDNGPGKNGKCMGCAADCKSFETCGDGVIDKACGEVCDDHNTKDGDGCSRECTSTEACGNNIIDKEVGEVCDDGPLNGTPGNPCSANCRSTLECGNGTVDKDKGEECDNGKFGAGNLNGNNNNNDCRADCQFNRCGDGFVDNQTGPRHEDCDDGQLNGLTPVPAETAACNIDCTTPNCGDGKVNRHFTPNGAPGPEQCDSGAANNDNAACTATCQINVCGDHLTFTGVEACDDGGVNTANCNANCTKPACGDGIVNLAFTPTGGPGPEQCDNGTVGGVNQNQDSAACTAACQINVCGDHKVLSGVEQCDKGGIDASDCDPDCTLPVCGDGHRNMAAGEACDDGTLNGTAASPNHCNQFCQLNGCGDGIVEPGEDCDAGSNGHPQDSAACNSNCTFARCGDGVLNTMANETCDDGAANGTADSAHNCNQFCHANFCGNGILDLNEECDDGTDSMGHNNNHAGAHCNAACKLNVCGDGDPLTGIEQCDPGRDLLGNNKDTALCDHDCTLPVCGDGIPNTLAGEECDDGPDNGTPQSAHHCDSRCKSNLCGNGITDVGEDCDDGANGHRADSDRCNSDCTFAQCGDGKVNPAFKPDGVHFESCDNLDPATNAPLNGVPCDYGNPFCIRCNATCTGNVSPGGPFCGNGIPEASEHEDCDPATGPSTSGPADPPSRLAKADAATCNIDCTVPSCGDRHVNVPFGEHCDDGNNDACGTCGAGCTGSPVASATAFGSILVAAANDINDNDTFTLDDGFNPPVTFVFHITTSGVLSGNVSITVADNATVTDVANAMIAAINTTPDLALDITADLVGMDTVSLTNDHRSALGNTTIGRTGKIAGDATADPPQLPTFGFTNLDHGAAGDCPMGTGCVSSDDCKYGCDTVAHVCNGPPPPPPPPL
jgi:cysteine-rich repeat protein